MSQGFVPARQAYATTKDNAYSRWPVRSPTGNRLFPACAPHVEPNFQLPRGTRVFAIGSCFARNIEEYLVRLGIDVASYNIEFPQAEMGTRSRRNDLIVKYTPPSILQELRFALDGSCDKDEQFKYIVDLKDGSSVDLNLPSWYSAVPRDRAIQRRKQINALFAEIRHCNVVIITLGLIECWHDNVTGGYICESPSPALIAEYPDRFAFKQLRYDEALRTTQASIDLIKSVNPSARIILTTSPVPLGRTFTADDIIVANTYSKSMLRTVAGELAAAADGIDYYPSYEMVMFSDNQASWSNNLRQVNDAKVGEVVLSFIAKYFPETHDRLARDRQLYAEARVQLGKGRNAEAFAILDTLKDALGHDRAFLNDLCHAAEKTGRCDQALALHEQLDLLGDEAPGRMIRRANFLAGLGQHDKALHFATMVLSRRPSAIDAKLITIDALIGLGQTSNASAAADKVLEHLHAAAVSANRQQPWVFARLRKSYTALGNNEKVRTVTNLEKRNAAPELVSSPLLARQSYEQSAAEPASAK